ncbi:hypothetical protein F8388_023213 [Cannabis sativa]|uniref:glyoxylate reductase (NADP(+)) n=2 Tax=Cannabis sativa TaxID=3483 RepID=A0A7J6HFW3_CANSA|nr:hypothetical protein F8388_023213 [Cannabis sativa]
MALPNDQPQLLLIVKTLPIILLPLFDQKFRLVKVLESELPLDQFLKRNAISVRAMIASHATSVNADLLQLLRALRMVVTSSAGVNQESCLRLLHQTWVLESQRGFSSSSHHKLGGKRVGIVGLGSIGCEVGKGLETFGCTISYNSKSKKPSITYSFYSNVKELAENNVIIILCCSLTDETYHMVNKEVLSTLGKEGVIVNVGRGALINEKELVRCLVGEYIKGAGLDVFENDNASNVPEELFQLDNVVFFLHTLLYLLQSLLRRLLQL